MRVLGVFFCWTFFVCRKTQETKKLGSFGCMSLIVFFNDVYIYIYIYICIFIYIYLFIYLFYLCTCIFTITGIMYISSRPL